jgi:hypothetical protein
MPSVFRHEKWSGIVAYVNVGLIEPGRVLASAVFRTASMPLSCESFFFSFAQVCYVVKVGEALPV